MSYFEDQFDAWHDALVNGDLELGTMPDEINPYEYWADCIDEE